MATRSVYIVKAFLVEVSTSSIIGLISYPEAPLVTNSQTHRFTSSQAHRRRLRPLRCRPSSNPYNNNNPLGTDFVDSPLVTQRMGACPVFAIGKSTNLPSTRPCKNSDGPCQLVASIKYCCHYQVKVVTSHALDVLPSLSWSWSVVGMHVGLSFSGQSGRRILSSSYPGPYARHL